MTVATVREKINEQKAGGAPRQGVAGGEVIEVSKFPTMLKLYEDQVSRALPAHLKQNVARYTRLALSEFRQNTKLAECDPLSVFAAVIMASQMGWEIGGVLGQCYLVPYGGKAQLIPGWKGLTDLVHRAGRAAIWTGCVFQGDLFDFRLGDSPFVNHVPKGNDNPEEITAAYAIGKIRGMENYPICEVWPIDKLIRHRDRYNKVGRSHYSFDNMEMYVRKVVLLQDIKYLPVSAEMNTALTLDAAFETGRDQGLTIDAAVNAVAEGMVLPTGPAEKHVDQTPAQKPAEEQKPEPTETVTPEEPTVTPEPAKVSSKPTATPKAEAPKAEKKTEPKKTEPKAATVEPPLKVDSQEPPPWAKDEGAKPEAQVEPEKPATAQAAAATATATAPAAVRIKSPHKHIREVAFPEYIDRLSDEDAWTPEQYERLMAQGARLQQSEDGLNATCVSWMGQPLGVINREAMEALITVLTSYKPEMK